MIWRSILSLSFAVMLVLTSQAMAAARGAAAATGTMVICTGDGTITVYTDLEGAPVATPHVCPECIVQAVLASSGIAMQYPQDANLVAIILPVRHRHEILAPATGWHSRAPPFVI